MTYILKDFPQTTFKDMEGKSEAYKALMTRTTSRFVIPGSQNQSNELEKEIKSDMKFNDSRLHQHCSDVIFGNNSNNDDESPDLFDEDPFDTLSLCSQQATKELQVCEPSVVLKPIENDNTSENISHSEEVLKILNLTKVGDIFNNLKERKDSFTKSHEDTAGSVDANKDEYKCDVQDEPKNILLPDVENNNLQNYTSYKPDWN